MARGKVETGLDDPTAWYAAGVTAMSTGFLAIAARLPALVRRAIALAWRTSRLDTALVVCANLAGGVLTAFGLLATQNVAAALLATGLPPDRVRAAVPALAVVVAATAARATLALMAGWLRGRLVPRISTAARQTLVELAARVEVAEFDDPSFADELDRAEGRGVASAPLLVGDVLEFVTGAVGVLATALALLVIHPLLVALATVAALPAGWAAVRAARHQYLSVYRRVTRRRRLATIDFLMTRRYPAVELRVHNLGGYLAARHGRLATAELHADLSVAGRQTAIRFAGAAAGGLAIGAVYLVLGWLTFSGGIALAAAATAVLALQNVQAALRLAVISTNSIYENGLYYADYVRFVEATRGRLPMATGAAPVTFNRVGLHNVSLRYPGTDRLSVDGVNIGVRRGQTIALVGENGSGKTTVAKILAGLYRPTSGTVRWDETDLATVSPDQIRERTAMITQECWRWPFTARENIQIGRHERCDGDGPVVAAARKAGAHDAIAALPNGYDTLLDRAFAGGEELSGGQWQRLAAARALYRDADLLVCDEPSAALDARAEDELFRRLRDRHHRANRAVVLVTHRLANVRHADLIYVLHAGRVVEQGTHDELVAAGGRYGRMFRLQAAGYRTS